MPICIRNVNFTFFFWKYTYDNLFSHSGRFFSSPSFIDSRMCTKNIQPLWSGVDPCIGKKKRIEINFRDWRYLRPVFKDGRIYAFVRLVYNSIAKGVEWWKLCVSRKWGFRWNYWFYLVRTKIYIKRESWFCFPHCRPGNWGSS